MCGRIFFSSHIFVRFFLAAHAISFRVQRSRIQHRSEMQFKLRRVIRRYIYIYVQARLLYSAAQLLVKIHLITEHYRAEGVMIAALARNRNRSGRREREEFCERLTCINCLYPHQLIRFVAKIFQISRYQKIIRGIKIFQHN